MKLIFALTGSIKGERGARGGANKRKAGKKRRERERERAASSGPTLKLTKEFRFLYNRFNLIPALDRSGEDVSGERISISERYSPDPSGLPTCPAIFPALFLTRRLLFVLQLFVLFSRSSRPLCVCTTAKEVFLDTVVPATRQGPTVISITIKIVRSIFIVASTPRYSGDLSSSPFFFTRESFPHARASTDPMSRDPRLRNTGISGSERASPVCAPLQGTFVLGA